MDTNVPVKASCILDTCKIEELELIGACIEFMHRFMKDPDSKLVLDMDREIVGEYENNIKKTDMGNQFFRWLYTYMNKMDIINDMIKLEHINGNYCAFPNDEELNEFDAADRKFVALALTHSEKPPIVQAADGKWLGFVERLKEYGIDIEFLDINYASSKYNKKIRDKRN